MNKEGVALHTIISFANELLEVAKIEDYPGAVNGLQLENRGTVSKIGAAVDASSRTIEMAINESVDLLIVHHGIFWGGLSPVTGPAYRRLAKAMEADLANRRADRQPLPDGGGRAMGAQWAQPKFWRRAQGVSAASQAL